MGLSGVSFLFVVLQTKENKREKNRESLYIITNICWIGESVQKSNPNFVIAVVLRALLKGTRSGKKEPPCWNVKDHVQEKVPCSFGFFETVYLLVNLSTRGWAVISLPQGWIRRWVLRLPHIRVQLPPASMSALILCQKKSLLKLKHKCNHFVSTNPSITLQEWYSLSVLGLLLDPVTPT